MVETYFSLAFRDYSGQPPCKAFFEKVSTGYSNTIATNAAPVADVAPVRQSVVRPPADPGERLESNKHLID